MCVDTPSGRRCLERIYVVNNYLKKIKPRRVLTIVAVAVVVVVDDDGGGSGSG